MSLQFLSDKETLPSQSHTTPVVSVCWTAPSTSFQGLILSGDCTGVIKAYDASSALAYRDLPRKHSNAVHCITTNAVGNVALSSAIDGTITLWNLDPFLQSQATSTDDNIAAETTAVSQEPPLLPLPVQDPNSLILGHIDSLTSNNTAQVKLSEAWKTALHPTAPFFAAIGAGAVISLHSIGFNQDAEFGAILAVTSLPPMLAKQKNLFGLSLAFNATGTLVSIGTDMGQVLLYTLSTINATPELNLISTYADHALPIRALSFTPDLLIVGSDDRTISVHDIKPILSCSQSSYSVPSTDQLSIGNTVALLPGHKGWVLSIATWSWADKGFASIGADKSIKFWDLESATKTIPVWNGTEMQQLKAFAFQPAALGNAESMRTNSMIRFITASQDGKLRWYRGAGLG